jgi:hypothetical protein
MSKSILFLTTLNLATNPRLVKEIDLALSNNYNVTVICFEFNNWSKNNNDAIVERLKDVNFIIIPAGRNPFLPWLYHMLKEKIYRILARFIPLGGFQISQAVSRRSGFLINAIKKINHADLVIGHNPGALYPTMIAAKKYNCPAGFDMEDYHPGENSNLKFQNLFIDLMAKILPTFNYISYSSKSIYRECISKIPCLQDRKSIIIHNSFSSNEFAFFDSKKNDKLELVWFSQNIDKNRGLENIIPIVDKYKKFICLTLYGNLNDEFKYLVSNYDGFIWGGLISQLDLHHRLSTFDIGLALEPGKDLNNELALSNKLIAYLQAGLYVVATETIEQKKIVETYPDIGILIKKDFSNADFIISNLIQKKEIIRSERLKRYNSNRIFDWENTSSDLLSIWEN